MLKPCDSHSGAVDEIAASASANMRARQRPSRVLRGMLVHNVDARCTNRADRRAAERMGTWIACSWEDGRIKAALFYATASLLLPEQAREEAGTSPFHTYYYG